MFDRKKQVIKYIVQLIYAICDYSYLKTLFNSSLNLGCNHTLYIIVKQKRQKQILKGHIKIVFFVRDGIDAERYNSDKDNEIDC